MIYGRRELFGLIFGPLLTFIIIGIGPPSSIEAVLASPQSAESAWLVMALLVWMAVWWITEAIPIPVTALLPLVYLPLTGTLPMKQVSSEYMHPIIVLLLGGFIVAKAIEKWRLHTRISLKIISFMGAKPKMILAGFMAAAAFLSMWISNSATSIMLLPIALSLVTALKMDEKSSERMTYAVLLGIAYACSVGGLGTPIGTPTNLIIIGYLSDNAGLAIDFSTWMKIGIPTVIIMVPLIWLLLSKVLFKLDTLDYDPESTLIEKKLDELGPLSTPEKRVLLLFALIAAMWGFKNFLNGIVIFGYSPLDYLTDSITAIIGVFLCFLIPAGSKSDPQAKILDWATAENIPWGPLLLFGGGMSLALAIQASGLALWLGEELSFIATLGPLALVVLMTLVVIFLTEVMSNVATAATLMPVLGAAAISNGVDVELLAFPIALAASCAFMLPTATGPNAVVFSSGKISLPNMVKAGFWANILAVFVLSIIGYLFAPLVIR